LPSLAVLAKVRCVTKGLLCALAAALVVVGAAAVPASANPYPWATVRVGEVRTLTSPDGPCLAAWQIDFGAQFLAIVSSSPGSVVVRGTAVSDGPLKLRCRTAGTAATGGRPYDQALWVQVLAAAPDPVVPEAPLAVLLPATGLSLAGATWLARRRLQPAPPRPA
jgi:hypothetical protein